MSSLSKFDGLEIPAAADFHVHLRDGKMMETVVPTIRMGGVNTVGAFVHFVSLRGWYEGLFGEQRRMVEVLNSSPEILGLIYDALDVFSEMRFTGRIHSSNSRV